MKLHSLAEGAQIYRADRALSAGRAPQMAINAAAIRAEQRKARIRIACILVAATAALAALATLGTHAAAAALLQAETMLGM